MPNNNSESLVNTKSSITSLDSVSKLNSNIQLNNLSDNNYIDPSVQTVNTNVDPNVQTVNTNVEASVQTDIIQVEASVQAANTYVNTGMQTSPRMWLEYIRNWIDEILSRPNPNPNPQYKDVNIQTNAEEGLGLWGTVKQWFLEVSLRGALEAQNYHQ